MNFEQVLPKACVACFDNGQRSADHFADADETVPRSRRFGLRRRNVKCAGVTPGVQKPRFGGPPMPYLHAIRT